jgi:probable HAF family extracellular repeat protein
MNGAGHFVGTLGGNGQTGFWWSEATGIVVLPIPSGATSCAPRDVNDLDQIIGTCSFPMSTAVYWESPTAMPVILPRLAGYTAGYIAYALNNHGDAAGTASTTTKGGKYIHAGVYWARSGSTWVAANIGTLGGTTNPTPEAINDAGWIVGADNASGNTRHAFLWRPGVGMTDLGISGAESYAWSLTNSPVAPLIVGQSERNGHFRAIVWKPE